MTSPPPPCLSWPTKRAVGMRGTWIRAREIEKTAARVLLDELDAMSSPACREILVDPTQAAGFATAHVADAAPPLTIVCRVRARMHRHTR